MKSIFSCNEHIGHIVDGGPVLHDKKFSCNSHFNTNHTLVQSVVH